MANKNFHIVFIVLFISISKEVICSLNTPQTDDSIEEDELWNLEDFYDSSRPPPVEKDNSYRKQTTKIEIRPNIRNQMKDFVITNGHLKEYHRRLIIDLEKGLGKHSHNTSVVKCFVTYIQDLPTGQEVGTYLAVDLGGTNFRVLMVKLGDENEKLKLMSMSFQVPHQKMLGSSRDLFNYLATCVSIFVSKHKLKPSNSYSMGFSFSFPLKQKSFNKALIAKWTKGFNCSDAIGEDVGKLFQSALKRKGLLHIKIKVIINDSTGTLITAAWKNPISKIGLIIGTGTNACYLEKQRNAQLFQDTNHGSGKVVINTEWGAFGDDGSLDFIRTQYDLELDAQTINPGRQLHEKMISGMYMGEIVRVLLVHAVKDGNLFDGKGSTALFTPNMFSTQYVSQIEAQKRGDHNKCLSIFGHLGLPHATEEDCLNVRYICECVSTRAAHMVAAGICALITKMGETKVAVGIDGSVYIHHPHFHDLMVQKIKELVQPGVQFQLILSEDGSGRGAALAAAVAAKYT